MSYAVPFFLKTLQEGIYENNSEKYTIDTSVEKYASVTVVVPCYRCVDTLDRAIQSVANQTLMPREVILIDDFII